MPNGTVKWFDSKKGFGFILSPEGKDVFVHFSSILGDGFRALKDGEQVEYEMMQGDKGLLAKNVRRMEAAAKIKNCAVLWEQARRPDVPPGRIRAAGFSL